MNKERRYHIREMRKAPTETETLLWGLLRSRQLKGIKFRRQHPIGPFIADFFCLQKRLIVELDGQHHKTQEAEDQKRTEFLKEQGFLVLRFWNGQVEQEPEKVLDRILKTINGIERHLTYRNVKAYKWNPLPEEGEGNGNIGGNRG